MLRCLSCVPARLQANTPTWVRAPVLGKPNPHSQCHRTQPPRTRTSGTKTFKWTNNVLCIHVQTVSCTKLGACTHAKCMKESFPSYRDSHLVLTCFMAQLKAKKELAFNRAWQTHRLFLLDQDVCSQHYLPSAIPRTILVWVVTQLSKIHRKLRIPVSWILP